MNPRRFFHAISYLQYPIMACALYFYVPFIQKLFATQELDYQNLDYFLIMLGVALSFSTLQDTTKTQNKLSRKVWENPLFGKVFLIVVAISTFLMIFSGLVFIVLPIESILKDMAVGLTVLGIGFLGVLKAAIEMFENHRLDKNPKPE
ncbi:MAG: hypothetical protein R8G66_09585 [Cytophagales bacterium]|nr:hypothetical protein [Cytophagales bacterium]